MANETVIDAMNDHVEEGDNISSTDAGAELISAAIGELPLPAVKDLLATGVCAHCLFRLFGVMECCFTNDMLSVHVLSAAVKKVADVEVSVMRKGHTTEEDPSSLNCSELSELGTKFCRICLGILQFAYQDEKGMSLNKVCAKDLAVSIVESVKEDGHTVDSFSLEVSLPASIAEIEQAIWSYIQLKHGSDPWFLGNSVPKRISVKDALKLSITESLENLLGTKCSSSSPFHIRLTYTNGGSSANIQRTAEKNETNKRRKTGTEDRGIINRRVAPMKEHSDSLTNVCLKSYNGVQNNETPDLPYFQLEKVSKPCYLSVSCARNPIYIGGRYLKYSRNVSQTRWVIDDERMGEASVEEIIGSNILPVCGGDSYKFHAAGREDIDVRMLGSGRPFLVEIQNARRVPSEASIKAIKERINSLENKLIGVKNVKELGSQGWDLMREGESEKQKQYAALVWISRSLEDDDLKNLSSLKDMSVLQKTPVRVLHRRSPLERPKIIHWMKVERIGGSPNYFLLHLCTQAGTYIKEFVHGDLGRTHPSVGSILGCRAEILQLDVTDVKMDFLNE